MVRRYDHLKSADIFFLDVQLTLDVSPGRRIWWTTSTIILKQLPIKADIPNETLQNDLELMWLYQGNKEVQYGNTPAALKNTYRI